MNGSYLPQEATLDEACDWLREQTGERWVLPRLLECGLMPRFWLDYTPGWPAMFGSRLEGYLAPVIFAGDTQRLAADRQGVQVNFTRTHDGKITKIGPPALTVPVGDLRFLRSDIEQLARDICRPTPQAAPVELGNQTGDGWEEQVPVLAHEQKDPVWQRKYARAHVLLAEKEKWERMNHQNDPFKAIEIDKKLAAIQAELDELNKGDVEETGPVPASQNPKNDMKEKTPELPNWKMKIQAEATAMCLRLYKSGANPTVHSIKGDLAKWCQKNGVTTDNGIFPNEEYLRTHVLSRKHWKKPDSPNN
jgi:hypothetical protein